MVEPADEDGPKTGPIPVRRPLPNRPSAADRPRVAARRPDARQMRLVYGAGALAALTVMSAGLVRQPSSATTTEAASSRATDPVVQSVEIQHVIRYIHLKPGEVAPFGATVITPDAPAPRVIVTHVAAPPAAPVHRTVVTRQSGRP